MPTPTQTVLALLVFVVLILLSAIVFMLIYNYAIVEGVSIDPATGDARLTKLKYGHALALMLLVSIFLSPTIITPSVIARRVQ